MKLTLEPKRKPRKRDVYKDARPWLLGTDEIPPPIRVPWQMWSKSSDPHQCGLITFEFTNEGISIGWWQDERSVIEWHGLAFLAGQLPRDIQEELTWLREKAEADGYAFGLAKGLKAWNEKAGLWPLSPEIKALVDESVAAIKSVESKDITI